MKCHKSQYSTVNTINLTLSVPLFVNRGRKVKEIRREALTRTLSNWCMNPWQHVTNNFPLEFLVHPGSFGWRFPGDSLPFSTAFECTLQFSKILTLPGAMDI